MADKKTPAQILAEFTASSKALDDAKRATIQARKEVETLTKKVAKKEVEEAVALKAFNDAQSAMLAGMGQK